MLHTAPWFRFPYPLQWGAPTFTWSSTLTMLAGAVSALVESVRRPHSQDSGFRVYPETTPTPQNARKQPGALAGRLGWLTPGVVGRRLEIGTQRRKSAGRRYPPLP